MILQADPQESLLPVKNPNLLRSPPTWLQVRVYRFYMAQVKVYRFWAQVIKDCNFCLGLWISLSDPLLRQAAILWAAPWRGLRVKKFCIWPTSWEELGPANNHVSELGSKSFFPSWVFWRWLQSWPPALLQPHERIWARTTQWSYSWIPDPQKPLPKKCLLTKLLSFGNNLLHSNRKLI